MIIACIVSLPENGLRVALPCTAYRRMPWQLLFDILANEEQDVQTHGTMVYKLKVADDILQVAYQTKLEEYHRVDALLAFLHIIRTGKHVQETQIQNAF